jgi:hypothetical protein
VVKVLKWLYLVNKSGHTTLVTSSGVQQIAVTLQGRVESGKVIVYTGTIAKATTCGREQ